MAEINPLQPLEPQPNRNVLQYGQRPPQMTFFLRAYPPPLIMQVPGGPSAVSNVLVAPPISGLIRPIARPGQRQVLLQTTPNPLILVSGQVHARALGALLVSPKVPLTGLVHARGLGAIIVTPPPVIPPVVPPVVSIPAQTPRNLRSVRRRNETDID